LLVVATINVVIVAGLKSYAIVNVTTVLYEKTNKFK